MESASHAASEHEKNLIQELRKRVADLNLAQEHKDDKNLVRWLRAGKQSITPAEQMLRKNHLWLKENAIDDLVARSDPPGWSPNGLFPWHICGLDKNNNPVLIAKIGEWDIRSAVAAGQGLDLISYCIKIMELATRFCARSNKGKSWMGQFVGIYDFKNFSFSQVRSLEAIQVIMQACQVFDSNYPEMLGQGFVVNAPWTFQILWKFVRPVMDEKTARKIIMLGSDRDTWRNEIEKCIPVEQFPKMYGGDGDDDLKMSIAPDGSPIILQTN